MQLTQKATSRICVSLFQAGITGFINIITLGYRISSAAWPAALGLYPRLKQLILGVEASWFSSEKQLFQPVSGAERATGHSDTGTCPCTIDFLRTMRTELEYLTKYYITITFYKGWSSLACSSNTFELTQGDAPLQLRILLRRSSWLCVTPRLDVQEHKYRTLVR